MADLQLYRFEPERVPNPEESESENEEAKDRLEGTFWCSCKRCQIMLTQRASLCHLDTAKIKTQTVDVKKSNCIQLFIKPPFNV